MRQYKEKLEIVRNRKKKLFDSYSDGIITKEEFIDIKASYEDEEKKYMALMEVAENGEKKQSSQKIEWLEHLQKYHRIEELDRSILAETLDKIYVKEDSKGLHVDIRFKFSLD
jgi:glutamate synthase domain-containing protein 3